MLLKFYVDEILDRIDDLLNYQQGAVEINSVIGDRLVSKLQDLNDELEILSHQLDFE